MEQNAIGFSQVVRMVAQAQKRPQSRLVVKLKGMILSCQSYQKKDNTIGYSCQMWHAESDGLIPFFASEPYDKGKIAEVELVLFGFNAFPLRRVGAAVK